MIHPCPGPDMGIQIPRAQRQTVVDLLHQYVVQQEHQAEEDHQHAGYWQEHQSLRLQVPQVSLTSRYTAPQSRLGRGGRWD